MLRQASVEKLRSGAVSRRDGAIVIAMRRYPRGLRKELRDEYLSALSPAADLFADFKAAKARLGDHNRAFEEVRYEERFTLPPEALVELARLSEIARRRDVFLVCQCGEGMRCHRDLLLLLARAKCGARVEPARFPCRAFLRRVRRGEV